jgi:DNA ligase (NAD+)
MSIDFFTLSEPDFYNHLIQLSNLYYETSSSPISDESFDRLVDIYEKRFNKSWTYLGNSYRNSVQLPIYMGSLNKCKNNHQIDIFKTRISDTIVLSDKIDGMSLLYYKKDNKISLYTRGDGFKGNDVSFLLKYINFPSTKKTTIVIRGELVMLKKIFEQKYKHLYDNPRAMVCGIVNSKDKEYDKLRDLTFYAYHIYDFEINTTSDSFKILESLKFNVPHYTIYNTKLVDEKLLSKYIIDSKQLSKYEVDGVVVSDNKIHIEKSGENPKHTIAFKILGNVYETTVLDVEWNLSKFNIYKPRIKIEPVVIDGSTINYTSGFNAKYIYDNKVGINTIIEMTKSGDVIPHIVNIVHPTSHLFPKDNWKWCDNKIDIQPIIETDEVSDVIFIKRIVSLFEACEIKGMKEATIKNIITNLKIIDDRKFFNINKNMIMTLDRVGDKSADNIINSIKDFKHLITIDKLMIGSCLMQGFGPKKINDVINNIPKVSDYLLNNKNININDLEGELKDIGFKTTAKAFIVSLKKVKEYLEENPMMKDWIINKEVIEQFSPKVKKQIDENIIKVLNKYKLNSNTFCFSGFRSQELEEYITNNGGNVVDSITKKVQYLIVKDLEKGGSKVEKAIKNNIIIINLNEN